VKPYYEADGLTIFCGNCREIAPKLALADAVVTDPPYGDTSLPWDRTVDGWVPTLRIAPAASIWCWGSMRFWLERAAIDFAGWTYAQDVVWEKHNGTNSAADRFRRVHEIAVQWYRGAWDLVFKAPQKTLDATARSVRRKTRPPQWGALGNSSYVSEDGGPRLMRSVIYARSCHGDAVHPTQKPVAVLAPLVRYSCPPGGVVLDPFMGGGSTLVAARDAGRRAIGIEVNEEYCRAAVERLKQGALPLAVMEG
jgi:site-specific DNA-methyltransferase (adenine-specific)